MAPPTRTPDKNTLQRWRDAGYTQQQMVELTEQEFGARVTRSAIANAMVRYGLAETGVRYDDYLPWRVSSLHAIANPARMLRLLARRNRGGQLNAKETDMLDGWLSNIAREKVIVAYDPADTGMGFYYVDQRWKDHKGPAPIRKQTINVDAVKPATRRRSKS